MTSFNYAPLTASPDKAAAERLRDESRATGVEPTEGSYAALLAVEIVGVIIFAGLLLFVGLGHPTLTGLRGAFYLIFFVIAGALLAFLVFVGLPNTIFHIRSQWDDFSRVQAFSAANDVTYATTETGRELEGAIFHMQGARTPRAGSIFRSNGSPGFELVGHYHYSRDKNEAHWGYIAVDFGRQLPHLVLRGTRRGRTHRNFLVGYEKSPVLPLTGSASQRFVLYGPADAAAEAQTLFGESLLSRLATLGRGIDAETIGTQLFIYSSKQFALPRPKVIRSLFEIVDTVIAERQ